MPRNIYIQKILQDKKEIPNKEYMYLITVNKGSRLEEAGIYNKESVVKYVQKYLS